MAKDSFIAARTRCAICNKPVESLEQYARHDLPADVFVEFVARCHGDVDHCVVDLSELDIKDVRDIVAFQAKRLQDD